MPHTLWSRASESTSSKLFDVRLMLLAVDSFIRLKSTSLCFVLVSVHWVEWSAFLAGSPRRLRRLTAGSWCRPGSSQVRRRLFLVRLLLQPAAVNKNGVHFVLESGLCSTLLLSVLLLLRLRRTLRNTNKIKFRSICAVDGPV